MYTCENNKYQKLSGQYELLKLDYSKAKDGVKIAETKRIQKEDSLNTVISQKQESIVSLRGDVVVLKSKLSNKKPERIPDSELAAYYNTRYEAVDCREVENLIGLTKDVAQTVVIELKNGDEAFKNNYLYSGIIKKQEEQISLQDSVIKDKDSINLFAQKELEQRKILEKSADENIENLNKQLKKQKNKNTLNKVLIGVGVVGGILIGKGL